MRRKNKIMLVDDDYDFLNEFEEMLQLSGYETKAYSNVDDALCSLEKFIPDLILVDLKMPGRTGFDMAEEVYSNPATKDIDVFVISAFCSDEDKKYLVKECGVNKCIQKPIKPLELVKEIENMFKKRCKSEVKDEKYN